MQAAPTSFELAVLQKLFEGDDPTLNVLRLQLESIDGVEREASGVGFFTHFNISETAPRLPGSESIRFGDVSATIDGLRNGAGFLVFIGDGCLSMLEGYTYDEPWPREVLDYSLSFVSGPSRDMTSLSRVPGWPIFNETQQ